MRVSGRGIFFWGWWSSRDDKTLTERGRARGMGRPPSIGYRLAVVVAAVLGMVGLWLPWVRKRPVGYIDGQPYYTSELIPGLNAGFQALEGLIVLFAILAIVAVVTTPMVDWSPRGVIIAAGAAMLWWSGTRLLYYGGSESYAVEPGLYLSVLSGIVLVILSAGTGIRRLNTSQPPTNENPPPG